MNKSPFPQGSQVCLYARDSGGETQEESIQQQIDSINQWCEERGLIVSNYFIDEASPGSSAVSRYGFQDMMAYFRNGARERGVVIWSYSRFAREINDAAFYKADLRRRGYLIHSISDSIPEGLDGRLFEAIIEWKDAKYLEDLSRDVIRGLHSLVKNHGGLPGVPPRGFKREPLRIGNRRDGSEHIVHRWSPDPDWVDLIRLAFEMRAMGKTYLQIQAATGIYSTMNSYGTFFSNELYTGVLNFGELVIPDYCDPIVDRETWERVQQVNKKFQRNNPYNHPRRKTSRFILSGIINCALCGAPMSGHVVTNTTRPAQANRQWSYYRCSRRTRRRDCEAPNIPQEAIEDAVIESLKNDIFTPKNIAERQKEIQETWRKSQDKKGKDRIRIERQLKTLTKKLNNTIKAIVDSGGSRTLLNELQELEKQEAGLYSQLVRLEERPEPDLDLDPKEVSARIIQALDLSREGTDRGLDRGGTNRQQIKDLLHNLIQRIEAARKKKTVKGTIFYYSPALAFEVCPHGEALHNHALKVKL